MNSRQHKQPEPPTGQLERSPFCVLRHLHNSAPLGAFRPLIQAPHDEVPPDLANRLPSIFPQGVQKWQQPIFTDPILVMPFQLGFLSAKFVQLDR